MKPMMDSSGENMLRSFLKTAIEAKRPALSYREVARRCERYGYKISGSYLTQFLNGSRRSLSIPALRAIGKVLDIPYVHLLKVAGYITQEELVAFGAGGGGRLPKANGRSTLDTGMLSAKGRETLLDYYEFLREKYPPGDDNTVDVFSNDQKELMLYQ